MAEIDYLNVGGRSIAYRLRRGNVPGLLFLPGYASDIEGTKAVALDGFAQERGLALLRFDYSGTGSSSGRFEDGTLTLWLEEALAVLDQLAEGKVILVGSSMGGWIALHLALLRPERVRALVGIAAAPDFTEWGFGADLRAIIASKGRLGEPHPEGKSTTQLMTESFWRSGQQMLLLDKVIDVDMAVRLLHGEKDNEVPLDIAFRLMRALRSSDVQLNVLKGAGHRLSEPHELDAIRHTVEPLLET